MSRDIHILTYNIHKGYCTGNRRFVLDSMRERIADRVNQGKMTDIFDVRDEPDRIDFDPFPWHSMAVWILTQMKRWGYIKGDVNYKAIAEEVYLATDAQKLMAEMALEPLHSEARIPDRQPERNLRQPNRVGITIDPV